MNKFELSPAEMQAISDYIDEGKKSETLFSATEKIFFAENQIRARLLRETRSLSSRLDRATKRIERIEDEKQGKILQGEFAETGLDSVDVAACLLHYLQENRAYQLTRSKLLHILFEAYAAWLHNRSERLFIEHPVCTEYGPQFWRVFKHIGSTANPVGHDAVKKIAEVNPGVAAFLKNVANKYYDYSESNLKSYVTKCPAYRNALPEKNGGKWNGEMKDTEIYAWKDAQKK